MARKDFWRSDWFLGVAVAVAVLVVSRTDPIQSLERKAYDLGVRASDRVPSERIAVIAIDDSSIANIGRWPWPRDLHAKLIDGLKGAHAKVIGDTVFFSEPQPDPGLPYVGKLRELFGRLNATEQQQLSEFGGVLDEAESALNTDRKLADSVGAAGNVILPALFRLGDPLGKPDKDLPEYIRKNAVQAPASDGMPPVPAASLDVAVLDEIGQHAASIINQALAKETQERFATGDQMAKAVRECAEVFGMVDVVL